MSNGGAVAALLAKKRKDGENDSDDDSEGSIDELVLEPTVVKPPALKHPPGYIGIMGKKVPTPRTPPTASAIVPPAFKQKGSHHAPHPKHHFVLEQIQQAASVTTQRKSEYADLFCFLLYLALFLVIVIMQSNASR